MLGNLLILKTLCIYVHTLVIGDELFISSTTVKTSMEVISLVKWQEDEESNFNGYMICRILLIEVILEFNIFTNNWQWFGLNLIEQCN